MLQNNCKNNGATNGLKQQKVKKHAKQLHMVNKKEEIDWGKFLIGAHTQNSSYFSTVTTQPKSRQAFVWHVLKAEKAHRIVKNVCINHG